MVNRIKAFMLILLTVTTLCCCSEENTAENPVIQDSVTAEVTDPISFFGYKYTICGYMRNSESELAPASGETARGDRLLAHYSSIEQTYDCKIEVSIADQTTINSDIIKASAAGKDTYATVCNWYSSMFDLINADLLYPLEDFECFSSLRSGKWGYENWIEAASLKGLHYGFNAQYWGIPTYQFGAVLYFNPSLIKAAGLADPFELIESKDWVWRSFEEQLTALRYTDDEGNPCGSMNATGNSYGIESAVLSNGCRYIVQGEDGKYKVEIDDRAIQALEWYTELCNKEIIINNRPNPVYWIDTTFIDEETAYTCMFTYGGTTDKNSLAYEMDTEFSWAPFPCGPQAEYGDWGCAILHGSLYFQMPVSYGYDNYEKNTVDSITGLLFEPFDGENGTDWVNEYESAFFFNKESLDMYIDMLQNAKDIHYTVLMKNNIDFLAVQNGKQTAATAIDSVLSSIRANTDEYLN